MELPRNRGLRRGALEPLRLSLRLEAVVGGPGPHTVSPLQAGQTFALQGLDVLSAAAKMVERTVVGHPGFGSLNCLPQCQGLPSPGQGPAHGGGGLSGHKDILVRQAASDTGREGHPGGPRAHNSRSPPATSRGRRGIYSSQWPPRVGQSAGAMTQAAPLRSPALADSLTATPHSRAFLDKQ